MNALATPHDIRPDPRAASPGHIAQSHRPDEWVSNDLVVRCEAFVRRLTDRVGAA